MRPLFVNRIKVSFENKTSKRGKKPSPADHHKKPSPANDTVVPLDEQDKMDLEDFVTDSLITDFGTGKKKKKPNTPPQP